MFCPHRYEICIAQNLHMNYIYAVSHNYYGIVQCVLFLSAGFPVYLSESVSPSDLILLYIDIDTFYTLPSSEILFTREWHTNHTT